MKTAKEWMDLFDPAWGDDPGPAELTLERVRAIQADAMRYAAELAEQNPHAARNIAAEAERIEKGKE